MSVTAVSGAGIAKLVQHLTEKPGAVLMQVLVPSVMIARRPFANHSGVRISLDIVNVDAHPFRFCMMVAHVNRNGLQES